MVACSLHTEKEVVGGRARAADSKNLEQVKELPVDVANNGDGCLYVYDVALLHEQLFCLGAYCLYDRLGEQLLSVQPFNAFV